MRALVVLALLVPSAAAAYPQFQLSTGASRCNVCHVSPAGGGILGPYGRDEAGDTISGGGDGRFLHGLWTPPKWLYLGGELRAAGIMNGVGATEGPEITAFPMQMELYSYFKLPANLSLNFSVGLRGSTRYSYQRGISVLTSDEHYLMWQPKPTGLYVRAGRFIVPYGLRVAEHPFYVRRYLGQNLSEEPYTLSGGLVEDGFEVHLSVFTPFILHPVGRRATGTAVYLEKRLGEKAALGGQMRVSVSPEDTQSMIGGVGKLWLDGPRLMLLGQADVIHQSFDDVPGASRGQLLLHAGASWMPARGWMASAILERFDEDLAIEGVARTAGSLQLQWFPTAHVELILLGRAQLMGSFDQRAQLLMLQAHYYL